MSAAETFDVGILTVIPVELQAVQDALSVQPRDRCRLAGSIYWKGKLYSTLLDRDITFILHCLSKPSQASASEGVTKMIDAFSPKVLILVGIAAGYPTKVKIGDAIVPSDIADLSVKVREEGIFKQRPRITHLPHPISQMIASFRFDRQKFLGDFSKQFGPAIVPKPGQEEDFAAHVTFEPKIHDNALASADTLFRDATVWPELIKIHQNIRAADMESGGFVRSCSDRYPQVPWIVIRGISDLGDTLKNDDFHRLASCAAATSLEAFIRDGLDLSIFDDGEYQGSGHEPTAATPSIGFSVSNNTESQTALSPIAIGVLNDEIERLAASAAGTLVQRASHAQESWRIGPNRATLKQFHEVKNDPQWRFIDPNAKCKILRVEAKFALALDKNLDLARQNLKEIQTLQSQDGNHALMSAIKYWESGAALALKELEQPQTSEEWNLRLGYLLELQKHQQVLDEFASPPQGLVPDLDSRRLYALALLGLARISEARQEIEELLSLQPNWFNVRIAWSILAYFDSLTPALLSIMPKSWPVPPLIGLVKRDAETLNRLRKAEGLLRDILQSCDLNKDARRALEGWRLACLANHAERQLDARTYCAELLEADPSHPVAGYWAIAREYPINLDASIAALESEIAQSI
jgi:nucleoside phosphorylase/tetratricopeptide (TPR) repeat protein